MVQRSRTLALRGLALGVIVAVIVLAALLASGKWRVQSEGPAGVTASPSGPVVTASVGPNTALPPVKAGSNGCAQMDRLLSSLLADTPEGRAFVAKVAQRVHDSAPAGEAGAAPVPGADDGSTREWIAFLRLLGAHGADFATAAGTDPAAKAVLPDLDVVVARQPALLNGSIPQYDDPDDALGRIQRGEKVEVSKEYTRISTEVSEALDRLAWCMPTWPVVF